MKRILLNCLMLTMLLTSVAMQAQDKTVSGKVTGGDDGLPLPQVSVFLKGNPTSGVPTDVDGNYRLTVPQSGGVLVFRYLGYITQEQAIGNQTTINIVMQPEVTSLEEFVVTGYGVEKRERLQGQFLL